MSSKTVERLKDCLKLQVENEKRTRSIIYQLTGQDKDVSGTKNEKQANQIAEENLDQLKTHCGKIKTNIEVLDEVLVKSCRDTELGQREQGFDLSRFECISEDPQKCVEEHSDDIKAIGRISQFEEFQEDKSKMNGGHVGIAKRIQNNIKKCICNIFPNATGDTVQSSDCDTCASSSNYSSERTNDITKFSEEALQRQYETCKNYPTQMYRLRTRDSLYVSLQRAKVQLQFYHKRNDELMQFIVQELGLKLNYQMESYGVGIDVIQCDSASEIKADLPVLVLCISTSRLGTDVSNAMAEIKSTQQTAILVFHHKRAHSLPGRTSDQVVIRQDLGGLFDLVFLRNKGIYGCEFNNKALTLVCEFIMENTTPQR